MRGAVEGIHAMRGIIIGLILAIGIVWVPLALVIITAIVWAR